MPRSLFAPLQVTCLLSTPQNPSGLDQNNGVPVVPYHTITLDPTVLRRFLDEDDVDFGPSDKSARAWKRTLILHLDHILLCPNSHMRVRLAGGIGVAIAQPGSAKRKFMATETPVRRAVPSMRRQHVQELRTLLHSSRP